MQSYEHAQIHETSNLPVMLTQGSDSLLLNSTFVDIVRTILLPLL